MQKTAVTTWLFVSLLALGVANKAGAEIKVGTAAAVNPDAFGTPPAQETRQLVVGYELIFNERITTKSKGQTQVLFIDESTLTVGPNSEVILDEFVYDPSTKTGVLSLSLNQGLIKFVGGRISKQGGVTIETPNATIAVRGGIAMVIYDGSGGGTTTATFPFGTATVTQKSGDGAGTSQQVSSSQVAVQVTDEGGIQETDAETVVDAYLGALTEGTGETGEATGVTEASVDQGFSENPEAAASDTTEPPTTGTTVTTTTDTSGTDASGTDPVTDTINDAVTNTVQAGTGTDATVTEPVPDPDPGPTLISLPGVFAGAMLATPDAFRSDFGQIYSTAPQNADGGIFWNPKTPLQHNLLGGSDSSVPVNSNIAADASFTLWASPPLNNAFGDPTFSRPYTTSQIQDGTLSADTDNDTVFDTFLPFGAGVDLTGGTTPYGLVSSGTAFADISNRDFPFFAYDLIVSDATAPLGERRVVLIGGEPTPASEFVDTSVFDVFAYSIAPDQFDPGSIPFLPSFISNQFPNVVVTDLLFARDLDTGGAAIASNLWGVLAFEGDGLTQKSLFSVSTGGLWTFSGTPHIDNGSRGFVRLDASAAPARLAFGPSTIADGNGNHFFGENIDYFVLSQSFQSTYGGANPADRDEDGAYYLPWSAPDEVYGFVHVASPTAPPTNLDVNDRSDNSLVPLQGFAAGMGENQWEAGPYPVINRNADISDFKLYTFPTTNTLEAIFDFGESYGVSAVNAGRIAWGGNSSQSRGTYITNDYFAARNYRRAPGSMSDGGNDPFLSVDGENTSIGGPAGYSVSEAFVTPRQTEFTQFNPYGRRDAFASAGMLPPDSFAPDMAFCTCEFLEWGFWSSEIRWEDAISNFRAERFHLGTWVAGTPSDPNATDFMNLSGQATFEGHVVADVWNNGNFYVEAADFSHTWDFDTRTGQVNLANFDSVENMTFSNGAIAAIAGNDAGFGGTFMDTTSAFTADLNGHFFQGGGDPAAASAGTITITDNPASPTNATYFASGTFATDKVVP